MIIVPKYFYIKQTSSPMIIKIFFIFMGLSLFVPSYAALPCTLFGAIGDSVQAEGFWLGRQGIGRGIRNKPLSRLFLREDIVIGDLHEGSEAGDVRHQ